MMKECKICQRENEGNMVMCVCGSTRFKHFTFADKIAIGLFIMFSGLIAMMYIFNNSDFTIPESIRPFLYLIPMAVVIIGRMIPTKVRTPKEVELDQIKTRMPVFFEYCKKCNQKIDDTKIHYCDVQ